MKKLIFTLVAVSFFLLEKDVYSQSAVAFCTKTGTYGYAYNYSSKQKAEKVALEVCKDYGGTNCMIITSTDNDGYGAIAIENKGKGKRIIGAAVGFSSLYEAKERALKEAKNYGASNPKIVETWYDK